MSRLKKPLYDKETLEYEVLDDDTLTSIASKFDIRVSILKQINRLTNDFIFPKDILFIPVDRINNSNLINSKSSDESFSGSTSSDPTQENVVNHDDYIIDFKKKIYSIKETKYITEDEGVVYGTLLLSTSVVMFEASSLDPQVIEFGHDRYSVIIPNECIVRYQIVDYPNILGYKKSDKSPTTFRLKLDSQKSNESDNVFLLRESPKNTNTFSTSVDSMGNPVENILLSKLSPFSRENKLFPMFTGTPISFKSTLLSRRLKSISEFENINANNSINSEEIGIKCSDLDVKEIDEDAVDGNMSCPATPIDIPRSTSISKSFINGQKNIATPNKGSIENSNIPFPMSGASFVYPEGLQIYLDLNNDIFSHDPNDQSRQIMDLADLPPLISPESSNVKFNVDHLSDEEDAAEESRSRHNSAKSQPIEFNSNDLSNIRVSGMRGNFQSFLGPSNMPALFKDYSDMALKLHDTISELPWYLIIECGLPLEPLTNFPRSRTGEFKNCLKPIFMFTVKQDRIKDLYTYLMCNFPNQYGDESEVTRETRGFSEIIDFKALIELNSLSRKNSKSNYEVQEIQTEFLDLSHIIMPVMSQSSSVINENQIKRLVEFLPAKHCIDKWMLMFSTEIHGTSLLSMFRSVETYETSSCLLAIKDNHSQVFGALLSHIPKISRGFYGDGRTFLYTFRNKFQVFKWSEYNSNLILGTKESLCIGAAEGNFGLYIDGDMNHGRTQKCRTFNNDSLSDTEDFFIRIIEIWVFANK